MRQIYASVYHSRSDQSRRRYHSSQQSGWFPALPQGKPEELTASFEERVEFLKTLPSALISVIMLKRMEFLNKVNFVITNFDRLIKVF